MTSRTHLDFTDDYKANIYNLPLDVSGWDKVTFHAIGAVASNVNLYGTLNPGDLQGVRDGNATLATDWAAIQMKKLSDGTMVNSFSGAGLYEVDVNSPFIKLQGADIYQLRGFFSKVH